MLSGCLRNKPDCNNAVMKFLLFCIAGGGIIILYLLCIAIYMRMSEDPIVFFASVSISAVLSVLVSLALFRFWRKRGLYDGFTVFCMGACYFLGLCIFAVFGPVFIDRSISYHIAFYAAEKQRIEIEDIRDEFSGAIFEKRIHDAIASGFIMENGDGTYSPSLKAKAMAAVLMPLGKMTGTLDTYEDMKEEVEK